MTYLSIDWNPSIEIFKIGSFAIRYYSLMFVIAFILGLQFMKKEYENVFVMIYGRISDRTTEINEHSVIGMYLSMQLKGVNVIWLDNEIQIAYAMKRIIERFKEKENED